jgi:fumarylacetoacetase
VTPRFGVFRREGEPARVGALVEGRVVDMAAAARAGRLTGVPDAGAVFSAESLNPFMALGREAWSACLERLPELDATLALDEVEPLLPIEVADYVDFYSSRHHAENAGRIFRPDADEPLPPNWRSLPVGYHGRAGTVVPSGTPIVRPQGQLRGGGGPEHGPTRALDIELELGFVIGSPSRRGQPVGVGEALEHVFGLVLLNDWSARDIQAWETVPLGPFLGKSFATSIGAWVTPLEPLLDRRVPGEVQAPPPLDYLRTEPLVFDLGLEVSLNGATVARTNARHLYWTVEQQIAHLTANGASLRTGDLLGSGTISGPEREERGCFLELSWNGAEPFELPGGGTRTYLEDGDEVVLSGEGLAEVRGVVQPAVNT